MVEQYCTTLQIGGMMFGFSNMFGVDLSITKHVLMLWIVAAITIALTLYATRAYRKNINAKPKGIAHLYEILLEFVKVDIVLPNIGIKAIELGLLSLQLFLYSF